MSTRIFYSWQSDLPNATNRGFIQAALELAARSIRADEAIEIDPVIDRDTVGVPGSPDIAATILEKIDNCDLFVCDVSIINPDSDGRATPNPNVLIELGYALKRLGWARIVMVFNSAQATVEVLPFDLRTRRVLCYEARRGDSDRSTERRKLASALASAVEMVGPLRKRLDDGSRQEATKRLLRTSLVFLDQWAIYLRDKGQRSSSIEIKAREKLEPHLDAYLQAIAADIDPETLAVHRSIADQLIQSKIHSIEAPMDCLRQWCLGVSA